MFGNFLNQATGGKSGTSNPLSGMMGGGGGGGQQGGGFLGQAVGGMFGGAQGNPSGASAPGNMVGGFVNQALGGRTGTAQPTSGSAGGIGGFVGQALGGRPAAGGAAQPQQGGAGGFLKAAKGAFSQDPYKDFGPSDYSKPDPYDSQFGAQDFNGSLPSSARALSGRRKAVCIGINYPDSSAPLRGCINDALMMARFLGTHGFTDITMVTDDAKNKGTALYPTRANLLTHMTNLVKGAQAGDSLFLHYSGHGSQEKDTDGDEQDGMDETIVPSDYATAGQITDDVLHRILVESLPRGTRLTVIMDCCHSGSALDLPFTFVASDAAMANWWKSIPQMFANPKFDVKTAVQFAKVGVQLYGMAKGRTGQQSGPAGLLGAITGGGAGASGYQSAGGSKAVAAEVIMFSGCADSQTSADVGNVKQTFSIDPGPGGSGGACTSAFIASMNEKSTWTIIELLDSMRQKLKQRSFDQVPQLSSSRSLPLQTKWSLDELLA